MRKRIIMVMAVAATCLTIAACGNKNKKAQGSEAEAETETEVAEAAESEESELQEADSDIHMVCPFLIQIAGKKNENGDPLEVTRYYYCDHTPLGSSNFPEWVMVSSDPSYKYNVDGWHFVGKDIVNADETLKICDEWAGDEPEAFSSYCTVTTEPYKKPSTITPYDYFFPGRIMTLWEEDCPFTLNGVKLFGNRHDMSSERMQNYAGEGHMSEGFLASFYLNEYITLSIDYEGSKKDVQVICLPHNENYEGVKVDDALLEKACFSYNLSEIEDGEVCFEDYISIDHEPGVYELLFAVKDKPAYLVALYITEETTVE